MPAQASIAPGSPLVGLSLLEAAVSKPLVGADVWAIRQRAQDVGFLAATLGANWPPRHSPRLKPLSPKYSLRSPNLTALELSPILVAAPPALPTRESASPKPQPLAPKPPSPLQLPAGAAAPAGVHFSSEEPLSSANGLSVARPARGVIPQRSCNSVVATSPLIVADGSSGQAWLRDGAITRELSLPPSYLGAILPPRHATSPAAVVANAGTTISATTTTTTTTHPSRTAKPDVAPASDEAAIDQPQQGETALERALFEGLTTKEATEYRHAYRKYRLGGAKGARGEKPNDGRGGEAASRSALRLVSSISPRPFDRPLRVGDTLLLEAPDSWVQASRTKHHFAYVSRVLAAGGEDAASESGSAESAVEVQAKFAASVVALLVLLVLSALEVVSLFPLALSIGYALVAVGCISLDQAWRSISYRCGWG